MEFALIWYSQYGKEEIDTTTDSQEAIRLRDEYQLAYGEVLKKVCFFS